MENRKKPEMTDVADKDTAARCDNLCRLVQDCLEVIEIRKILNDRIKDRRIKRFGSEALKVCRLSFVQFDMTKVGSRRDKLSQPSYRRGR